MKNTSPHPWWKHATIYHIYPRSFRDTSGDGFGDLPGIVEKLPYLRDTGIDAIWMGPIFSSPQVDNGYDICDYRRVDPRFGSNDDLDRLIEEAHTRGIRVLLDLVFNHSSDRHPWFQASRRGDATYGDFYIWRDAPPDGSLPNDWVGFFSLPAWSWDELRGQYYLHLFAREQPDLNWDHPPVRKALIAAANFWVDRGVDGFRMDVINMISKHPDLPSLGGGSPGGIYLDGPNTLAYLQEFRAGLHRSDELFLVGETPGITAEAAVRYTTPENNALDTVLLFDHLSLDHGPGGRWDYRPLDVAELRDTVERWQAELADPCWPSIYMSNHDQPRIVSRYGDDGTYRRESAMALAILFYLQRGTPIVYQGDEIGMRNFPITTAEEIVDIESANAYRKLRDEDGLAPQVALERIRRNARDNGRTPMQWNGSADGGFTDGGAPWYPVNPDYPQWNVAAQREDAGSVYALYRRLFSLRRDEPALRNGDYEPADPPPEAPVIAYRRRGDDATVTVVVNLGGDGVSATVAVCETAGNAATRTSDMSDGMDGFSETDGAPETCGTGAVILSTYPDPPSASDMTQGTVLRPWEAIVYRSTPRSLL